MTFKIPKVNWPKVNWPSIYKIGLIEVLVLFTILFFTFTMPLTVNKFSSSFFGKLLILLSIGLVSHYKIIYGIVLAVLFIVISEIGYMESFSDMESFIDKKKDDKKKEGMEDKKKKNDKKKDDKKKKEGMEIQVQASKTAFIKDHCGAKRVNFDLQTIQQDYTALIFSDGVCDPCDPGCKFSMDNTSDSLYNYDKNVHPVDKRQ